MRKMRTIADLEWALKNDPEIIHKYKEQVTIEEDLKRYMKEVYDSGTTIKVRSTLKRAQGRTLGIHPSSACKKGVCQLKLYYECVDKIEPRRTYDPKMQEIWDLGTMIHDRLQTFLRNMYGDQFQDEALVSVPELHVIGNTDGVFMFSAHDGLKDYRFVLEIKSVKEGGNFGFAKVQAKPFEDNVRQAHFYMKGLDVPFALMFYAAKNTGEYKEHVVAFDPKIWAELEKTIEAPIAAAYGDGGATVKASPGWACRWCDYEYECKAAQKKKGGRSAKGSKSWKR